MLFADDQVLCDPDREMMELRLERWRECMEKNGFKVSRAKTEHLQTTGDTEWNGQLANSPILQLYLINNRQKGRSQQKRR